MYAFCNAHGEAIVGTSETLSAVANVDPGSFLPDGSFQHAGYTEPDWDNQVTDTQDGKILFVCEGGETHTLDECVLQESPIWGEDDTDEDI